MTLNHLFDTFKKITQLKIRITNGSGNAGDRASQCIGSGSGQVVVEERRNSIIFRESGKWSIASSWQSFAFSNVYQWTIHRAERKITLGHLRYSEIKDVRLAEFHLQADGSFDAGENFYCSNDCYSALLELNVNEEKIKLQWKVQKKNSLNQININYWSGSSKL